MSAYETSFNATYESLCARGYGREVAWRTAMSIADSVNAHVPFISPPQSPFDMNSMSNALPNYSRRHNRAQEAYPDGYSSGFSSHCPNYSYSPYTHSAYGNYNVREARPSCGRGSLYRGHDDHQSTPRSYTHEPLSGRDREYEEYSRIPRSTYSHTECPSSYFSSGYHIRTAVPSGNSFHDSAYEYSPKEHGKRTAVPSGSKKQRYEANSSRRRRRATTSNSHSYSSRLSPEPEHAGTQGIGRRPEVDLYTVLGVSPTASAEEIKKAHRTLSLQYHPDRAQGDKGTATDKMAELNRAYDVLKNKEKRMHYDRVGEVFDRL